jgi:hypothetical protein
MRSGAGHPAAPTMVLHELTHQQAASCGASMEVWICNAPNALQVKFCDTGGLEVLSAGRHSGGEKSVSTIMFLLSLQKITRTPFRVVDEINQGMDQTNERKVFQARLPCSHSRSGGLVLRGQSF